MTHKRSIKALRKRLARRIIFATSFHDPLLSETVARANVQYRDYELETHKNPLAIVSVEHGEILHDERARGTMD